MYLADRYSELIRNDPNQELTSVKTELYMRAREYAHDEVLSENEADIDPYFWEKVGPTLAIRVAIDNLHLSMGSKWEKTAIKDIHRKRAMFFNVVKETTDFFDEILYDFTSSGKVFPKTFTRQFSFTHDLEIELEPALFLEVMSRLVSIPSDKAIFETARMMLDGDDKSGIIKNVDELINFSGISNFKSFESSLAKGRKGLNMRRVPYDF